MKTRIFILLLLVLSSCQKDFLDTKPNKALLIPTTISDMQALLDNIAVFNLSPGITGIADGDFYTTDAGWKAWGTDGERNSYIWAADIFNGGTAFDWTQAYQQVFYANVVLDGLTGAGTDYNTVKGTALFSRAYANYHLLQIYAPAYNAATAATDAGIPLRLVSDVSRTSSRASVQAGYDQVLADLRQARILLPASATAKSRPITAAAFAMLARTCLAMNDYIQAGKYADSSLQSRSALIDYNTLSTTATRPFPRAIPNGNDEVTYYASATSYTYISSSATLADSTLYRSYAANDLRKVILFKATGISGTFKGNYAGIIAMFAGIATDEMYLIRAECYARQNQTGPAMSDLNTLLLKRWKTGTFVPFTAPDAETALRLVLTERRKELAGRFTRWTDLRRLNTDSRFALTLNRSINGTAYTLLPGSRRYTYPLPQDEITLSGLTQNER